MFNLFGNNQTVYPIGIDLGTDSLKMVQIARQGNSLELIAAAKVEVPKHFFQNRTGRQKWLIETIREQLVLKPFKGHKACLAIPSSEVYVDHLRLNCNTAQVGDLLVPEIRDRLPFPSEQGIIRHVVVGDVYSENETRKEVILMAVAKRSFEYYMGMLSRCKLDAGQIMVESSGLISSFRNIKKSSQMQDMSCFLIDLGYTGTRIIGLHGDKLVFLRHVDIGAQQLAEAVQSDQSEEDLESFHEPGGGLAVAAMPIKKNKHLKQVFTQLRDEIQRCQWYHDDLFPHQPIGNLIFQGGLARQTQICVALARSLNMPSQLADSISCSACDNLVGDHSDILSESENYEWSLAYGLSLNEKLELDNC